MIVCCGRSRGSPSTAPRSGSCARPVAISPSTGRRRARAGSFLALCSTPELACEVTLQPLRRFALDAAILFSDILTIPWAMGLGLEFVEGEGPRFRSPVRTPADIDRLGVPDPEDDLGFVMDAIRTIRRELEDRMPLIGFAGSPWTLATYMIEGGSSRDFARAKTMLMQHPGELHRLLELLADATAEYLAAQVRAGAQALMIFDTWGRRPQHPRLPRILAPAHAYDRRTHSPRACVARGARGVVHQGRRRVARIDCAQRL